MTTIKIAYKVAKNLPSVPDGFIIDHFDTIEESIEGYEITSIENFNILFSQNGTLLHQYEINKNQNIVESQKVINKKTSANEDMFKEFLAWKKSQGK